MYEKVDGNGMSLDALLSQAGIPSEDYLNDREIPPAVDPAEAAARAQDSAESLAELPTIPGFLKPGASGSGAARGGTSGPRVVSPYGNAAEVSQSAGDAGGFKVTVRVSPDGEAIIETAGSDASADASDGDAYSDDGPVTYAPPGKRRAKKNALSNDVRDPYEPGMPFGDAIASGAMPTDPYAMRNPFVSPYGAAMPPIPGASFMPFFMPYPVSFPTDYGVRRPLPAVAYDANGMPLGDDPSLLVRGETLGSTRRGASGARGRSGNARNGARTSGAASGAGRGDASRGVDGSGSDPSGRRDGVPSATDKAAASAAPGGYLVDAAGHIVAMVPPGSPYDLAGNVNAAYPMGSQAPQGGFQNAAAPRAPYASANGIGGANGAAPAAPPSAAVVSPGRTELLSGMPRNAQVSPSGMESMGSPAYPGAGAPAAAAAMGAPSAMGAPGAPAVPGAPGAPGVGAPNGNGAAFTSVLPPTPASDPLAPSTVPAGAAPFASPYLLGAGAAVPPDASYAAGIDPIHGVTPEAAAAAEAMKLEMNDAAYTHKRTMRRVKVIVIIVAVIAVLAGAALIAAAMTGAFDQKQSGITPYSLSSSSKSSAASSSGSSGSSGSSASSSSSSSASSDGSSSEGGQEGSESGGENNGGATDPNGEGSSGDPSNPTDPSNPSNPSSPADPSNPSNPSQGSAGLAGTKTFRYVLTTVDGEHPIATETVTFNEKGLCVQSSIVAEFETTESASAFAQRVRTDYGRACISSYNEANVAYVTVDMSANRLDRDEYEEALLEVVDSLEVL